MKRKSCNDWDHKAKVCKRGLECHDGCGYYSRTRRSGPKRQRNDSWDALYDAEMENVREWEERNNI